jgi:uncharacterized membrane protein YgaE (UPF0421/DUF939 family)
MYIFLLKIKNNIMDLMDIILVLSFIGMYVGFCIYIYFISPKLNKRYFEKLRKEMEEDERTKNSIK